MFPIILVEVSKSLFQLIILILISKIFNIAQNQIDPFQVSEAKHPKTNTSKNLFIFKVPDFLNKPRS